MELVNIGTQRFTQVRVVDEIGEGGACHQYVVIENTKGEAKTFGTVIFQNGPIGENEVNGCHHEDLLAIVIHRLQSFQSGKYACRENALALTKIQEALHWLNHRTAERQKRGVEGTSKL